MIAKINSLTTTIWIRRRRWSSITLLILFSLATLAWSCFYIEKVSALQLTKGQIQGPTMRRLASELPCTTGSIATSQEKKLYELENRGYPSEINLDEAVDVFNKLAQCNETGKTQPPLTVDEVVAAIVAWDLKAEPQNERIFHEFQAIARARKMPKGSWLVFTTGTSSLNGYDTNAWIIDLYIQLDKYPADVVGPPPPDRLIRQQYISAKPSKVR